MASTTADRLPAGRALALLSRRRWLGQVAAGAAILLLAALLLLNREFSERYGPEGTARAFSGDLARGDFRAAWPAVALIHSTPVGTPIAADLATEAGLAAQLAITKVDWESSPTVTGSRTGGIGQEVTLGSGTHRRVLNLVLDDRNRHFGLYPNWRVVVEPVPVKITVPGGVGPLTLDGRTLPGSVHSGSVILVLPGRHRLGSAAGAYLAAGQTEFAAERSSSSSVANVALQPAVDPKAAPAIADAIRNAFATCLNPGTPAAFDLKCPNIQNAGYLAQWELIGSPETGIELQVGQDGGLYGRGHYLMLGRMSADRSHVISAGSFAALLSTDGRAFKVARFADDPALRPAPRLARPSSPSDLQVLATVGAALRTCATATISEPPDCPLYLAHHPLLAEPANVTWRLIGDPVAGAVVTWDSDAGLFRVRGSLSAVIEYDNRLLQRHYVEPFTTAFEAVVGPASVRVLTITAGPP